MKVTKVSPLLLILLLNGCGGQFAGNPASTTAATIALAPGQSEPAARLIFNNSNFVDLNSFVNALNTPPVNPFSTSYSCLGDLLRTYYADGDDYMGSPTAFPTPSVTDSLLPTNRPAFIKNVSVDVTNTYYPTTQARVLSTDVCSYRANTSSPTPSSCADFDRMPAAAPTPTVAPTAAPDPTPVASATPITTQYYGTTYYRVRDDWCVSQGPNVSPDPEATKAGVGGVSIDLDRTQLGSSEDLLMVITYHALNANSGSVGNWPQSLIPASAGTPQTSNDNTILKINLIGTQQSLDTLLSIPQPRPWTYANTSTYPIFMKEIATLEDPFGSLRTEQVYIPLSQNALIDRIRIERIRGSFHLFQVDLYRLGNRTE